MARPQKRPKKPSLGLENFRQHPAEAGLALDTVGPEMAEQLARGDDPYAMPADVEWLDPPAEPPADARFTWRNVDIGTDPASEVCPITPRTIVEAILFVGHPQLQPLSSQQMAALMRGVRPAEVDEIILELNREYQAIGVPYLIQTDGAGYSMVLRASFLPLQQKLTAHSRRVRLSQASIDILAIVAYHQPISRSHIDELRGKPSGGILSQLVRRQLLRLERDEAAPRDPIYHTTDRVLSLLGLDSLDDLPKTADA